MNHLNSPAQFRRQRDWSAAWLPAILAATALLYSATVTFGFVYDDSWQIVDNRTIRAWANVPSYFTASLLRTPYYRPLFIVWLKINEALFGFHPAGWHVMSVLAHVAVTWLVYLLVRRLASARVALLAAALFGLHPIHIESVAWISGVCDPLYAVLFLAAFLAYLKSFDSAQDSIRARWLSISWACYLLALLAKEPAIVFPAVVAIHAYIFGTENQRRILEALQRSAPYVAISVVFLLVRQVIIPFSANAGTNVPFTSMVLTEPSVLWFYLAKLFWPVDLNEFYATPYVTSPSLTHFLLPLLGIAIVAEGGWLWARRSPDNKVITFSAWWFLLTLAPALYLRLLPPGEIAHDRYLYLPSMSFCVLVALALTRWAERAVDRSQVRAPAAVTVGICLALAALNAAQQWYWASDATLYAHGFTSAPTNNNVANNYARLLTDRGQYRQAIPLYEQVLSRNPNLATAHYNLGYTYYRLGEFDKARAQLQRAVELDPVNSAFAYVHLGLVDLRENKLQSAEAAIRKGIELAPDRPGCHLALSFVLEAEGNIYAALAETREELRYSTANDAVRERERALEQRVGAER